MNIKWAEDFFKRAGVGVSIGAALTVGILFFASGYRLEELLLYEILPGYDMRQDITALFKHKDEQAQVTAVNAELYDTEIIGDNDIIYQEEDAPAVRTSSDEGIPNSLESLRKKYYIVDGKTAMTADYFNAESLAGANLKIKKTMNEPKLLVFHTHSREMFADSKTGDIYEGIVGAGERLCSLLEEKYAVKCLHITDSFDVVDGKPKIIGAYERMEPTITKVIKENPSIEMAIDMHRDGVAENVRLTETINGRETAQIMFFNGLCRLNENGRLKQIDGLENPYIKTNLALSFGMKLTADSLYPGLTRKIYLNAYRYSLHMLPKSMLIEIGAQTNTKQEIFNAVELLAEIINKTVFE